MELTHLLDTNAVLDYLHNKLPPAGEAFLDAHFAGSPSIISIITEMEMLAWRGASNNDISLLRSFIADSVVLGLSNLVEEVTINIRKHYGLQLPDAIIAASAASQNLTVITRNEKDFRRVPALKVINPWSA